MGRQHGIRVIIYIDDGIVAVEGKQEAKRISFIVQKDLSRSGLVINLEKCNWCPAMCGTWLGFELDLERGCISAPPDKVDTLKMLIRQAIGCRFIGAKPLAGIVGKIMSLSLALGPVARLMTKQ